MSTADDLAVRIEQLKKARDSGVLRIRHGDEDITYRSFGEIVRAISAAERELAALNGSPGRVMAYKFNSAKGL